MRCHQRAHRFHQASIGLAGIERGFHPGGAGGGVELQSDLLELKDYTRGYHFTAAQASIGLAGIESSPRPTRWYLPGALQSDLLELKGPRRQASAGRAFGFNRTCWN